MNIDYRFAFLAAIITTGCAGLALTAAILSGDKAALAQFFTTANGLFSIGAAAVIGLLAAGRNRDHDGTR